MKYLKTDKREKRKLLYFFQHKLVNVTGKDHSDDVNVCIF